MRAKIGCRPAEKSEKSLNSIFYCLLDLYRLTNDSTEDRRTTRSERFQHWQRDLHHGCEQDRRSEKGEARVIHEEGRRSEESCPKESRRDEERGFDDDRYDEEGGFDDDRRSEEGSAEESWCGSKGQASAQESRNEEGHGAEADGDAA
jgi:hypothetical protein